MSKSYLKSLFISGFRGASAPLTLTFASASRLTLIYGENGSGKTTICDAFEFLAKGKAGSLDNRGMGSGLDKFYPSAGKRPGDIVVRLESTAGICERRLNGRVGQFVPIGPVPRIEVLRQRQIAELVEAKPAERYEAIRHFIDISEFEQSEKALGDLLKNLKAERASARLAEGQSLETLQSFFEAAGKPAGMNPVSWARRKLAASHVDRGADIAAIARLSGAYSTLAAVPERIGDARKRIDAAERELADAADDFTNAAVLVGSGAPELLGVLEAGQRYVHAHSALVECPLCSSAEKVAGLPARISRQLEQLAGLRAATARKQSCETALAAAREHLEKLMMRLGLAVGELRTVLSSRGRRGFPHPRRPFPMISTDLSAGSRRPTPCGSPGGIRKTSGAARPGSSRRSRRRPSNMTTTCAAGRNCRH